MEISCKVKAVGKLKFFLPIIIPLYLALTVKETSDPIEVDNFVNEIDSMTLQLPAAEEVEF